MKDLACKDLGAADCNFHATGATNEEVKQKMMAHAAEAHADMMKNMTPEQMAQTGAKMDELLAAQ